MKKLTYLMPLFLVALFLAFAPTPTHAQGIAPEPTTCSHANNEFSGRIVVDINHDNLPAANEGVSGITVTLSNVQSGSTVLATTTTDSEGCWKFARSLMVNGQQHRIGWSGMSATTVFIHDPDNGTSFGTRYFTFTASPTEPADTDVVYRPESVAPYLTHCPTTIGTDDDVGGMVAVDRNNNNQADPGEGIAGVVVTLASVTPGQVVATTTTDANGCYRMPRNVLLGMQDALASAPTPGNIGWGIRALTSGPNPTPGNIGWGIRSLTSGPNPTPGNIGWGIRSLTTGPNPTPGNIGWGIRSLTTGPTPTPGNIGWGIRPLSTTPTPTPGNIGWGIRPTIARGANTPDSDSIGWGIRPLTADPTGNVAHTAKASETATTYMFVRAALPQGMGGELVESYDPNGRQTGSFFYDVFTKPNGTFESDFLFRDLTPTAVTMSTLNASAPATPDQTMFALAGLLVAGSVVIARRRHS